ncbi:MAG TPA: hypothetical protein VFJ90_04595 [Candidatus Didemnitutus sp.]|nr:hypothetical protein [Candidatus Didemnitutus sp.]
MKTNSKNVTLALLAATLTPWAYPLAAASRYTNADIALSDISTLVAMRERGRSPRILDASAALDARVTLEQIRTSTYEARAKVAADVEAKVDAASHAVNTLQDESSDKVDPTRQRFQEALRNAIAIEATVRSNIHALRVSAPDAHADARDQLASSYESYAAAIGELEALIKPDSGAS